MHHAMQNIEQAPFPEFESFVVEEQEGSGITLTTIYLSSTHTDTHTRTFESVDIFACSIIGLHLSLILCRRLWYSLPGKKES